jgi:hypothetical protein
VLVPDSVSRTGTSSTKIYLCSLVRPSQSTMDVSADGLCSVRRRRSGGDALRLLCAGLIRRLRLCRGGSGALGSKPIFRCYLCSVIGVGLSVISNNSLLVTVFEIYVRLSIMDPLRFNADPNLT